MNVARRGLVANVKLTTDGSYTLLGLRALRCFFFSNPVLCFGADYFCEVSF